MKLTKNTLKAFVKDLYVDPNFKWLIDLKETFPNAKPYLVGGKVRDLLLGRESADYDFVISHVPSEELQKFLETKGGVNLVGKSFGVFVFRPFGSTLDREIEIALPRTEHSFNTGGYRDFEIQTDPDLPIEKDLSRRDFTINAMAIDLDDAEIIDPFKGQVDLKDKMVRAVRSADERFKEDYTRMLRAVRFSTKLGFPIGPKTKKALIDHAAGIKEVPAERVQEELNKILLSKNVEHGFNILAQTGLLQYILPEIAEGIKVEQGKAHIYPVFDHLVKSADTASNREYGLPVILGALFHDAGKPRTKLGEGDNTSFYQHEYVGEKMCRDALNRLKYPKDTIKKATHLVRNHMFYYNVGEITDAGVRRLIAKVGPDNIDDLIRLRICDRLGMGRPKAKPFKLVELERRVKLLQTDPVSVKMLAIDGNDIMGKLKIKPSIRIKYLQNALLNEVLDDPGRNTKDKMMKRLVELNEKSDDELKAMTPDLEAVEIVRKKEVLKDYKGVE